MKLIESRILFEYLILAAYGLKVAIGQNPPSPCPDVFSYQQDGASWYGLITGRSSSYGDEIKTFIHMVYDGILKNGDLGRIARLTSNEDLREVVARGGAIRYRLNFNVYPLPRLRKIVFNGSVVCESVLEEGQFGNTTDVEHKHTVHAKGYSQGSPIRRFHPTAELLHPMEQSHPIPHYQSASATYA